MLVLVLVLVLCIVFFSPFLLPLSSFLHQHRTHHNPHGPSTYVISGFYSSSFFFKIKMIFGAS